VKALLPPRLRAVVSAGVLLLALVPPGAAAPRVSVVAARLEVPWALAFGPDGRMFVTERPGRIRVVRDRRLEPSPVATLTVKASGEGGLMGLAVDPAFAKTGHLYACYTADKSGRTINRLSVLTLRADRPPVERVLIDDIPGAGVHDGCRVKFGPDGKLYATTGDAAQSGLAQRRDALAGKILRLNADGSVPGDNPFPRSLVYSLGHRNPQGLAWDRAGGLWVAEHGPSGLPCCHDEINLVRAGRNYGWPEVYGRGGDKRFEDPVVESGRLTTWAPSGIAIRGDELYVAALRGQRLLRFRIQADGSLAVLPALFERTYGRLRDVVVGPDDALYVTTSNRDGRGGPGPEDDQILRVVP
jgi:glucose/arabinose dehydrogenase